MFTMHRLTHLRIPDLLLTILQLLPNHIALLLPHPILIISHLYHNLNISIFLPLGDVHEAEVKVHDDCGGVPEFGRHGLVDPLADLEEGANGVGEPTRGQLWEVVACETLAVGVVELGEVDVA